MGRGGEEVQVNVKVRRIFSFDWNFYFFYMRVFFFKWRSYWIIKDLMLKSANYIVIYINTLNHWLPGFRQSKGQSGQDLVCHEKEPRITCGVPTSTSFQEHSPNLDTRSGSEEAQGHPWFCAL